MPSSSTSSKVDSDEVVGHAWHRRSRRDAELESSYPAVPDSVPRARSELVRFAAAAGASPEVLDDLRLAVSEALTNVVVHAYRDEALPGRVDVAAARIGGQLLMLVADAGCGLGGHPDSPGLGLGIALMLQLSSGLEVSERALGGTQVTLRFPLSYGRLRNRRRELSFASTR
jgi:serine/threonine-protein kinase RsbW